MGDEEAPVRTERAWFLFYFPRWGNQRADDPPSLTLFISVYIFKLITVLGMLPKEIDTALSPK
jgi:hypothetical protein